MNALAELGPVLQLPPELTATLDAVGAPLLVHAGDLILHANAAMLRLIGCDASVIGRMSHEAWAAEAHQASLRQYGQRCLADDGEQPVLEIQALTANGSTRQVEITGRHLRCGGLRLAVLSCQDLSDMQHVQHSLLHVGRLLHQIIENGPIATFVIDAEHRVTHWNAACARLTGTSAREMLGSTEPWRAFYSEPRPLLADLIVAGKAAAFHEHHCSVVLRESPIGPGSYETEEGVWSKAMGPRWIFASASPLCDNDGRVIGSVETLLDMTDRRNAEEALRQHQLKLEQTIAERSRALRQTHDELDALLDNAEIGIIVSSGDQIIHCNHNFIQMFALGEQGPAGVHPRDLFPDEETYRSLSRTAAQQLRAGQTLQHEMELCRSDGRRLWVQMTAYSASPDAPMEKVWWLMQDRSNVVRAQRELVDNFHAIRQTNARLEEAQNQLLQSEKLASIGQLAAGVAHEINNPIAFVNSNLASLRRSVTPLLGVLEVAARAGSADFPAQARQAIAALGNQDDMEFLLDDLPKLLDESAEGLGRVTKIVQDLKDFSRVDNADWQEADLNQGLESTLNVVMNEVKYRADVLREYGSLPRVRCLAGQLNQVFMNLIVNAAHAIDGRGVIRLKTWAEADWACVEVTDNGRGMSAEVQRRIFEPFFTTKPVGQGTGLGLSLSFSIVKKHGGRIEVESEPGQGSRMRIWVPIRGPQEPPQSP